MSRWLATLYKCTVCESQQYTTNVSGLPEGWAGNIKDEISLELMEDVCGECVLKILENVQREKLELFLKNN